LVSTTYSSVEKQFAPPAAAFQEDLYDGLFFAVVLIKTIISRGGGSEVVCTAIPGTT
jgi:hypothetical protein